MGTLHSLGWEHCRHQVEQDGETGSISSWIWGPGPSVGVVANKNGLQSIADAAVLGSRMGALVP